MMKSIIQTLRTEESRFFDLPKDSHIFLDTSFLIDAFQNDGVFDEIFKSFALRGCQLLTIDAVLYEFTKGRKNIQEYNKRINFFDSLIHITLPIDPLTVDNCLSISRAFLIRGAHVSYVDALLLATIMRYNHTNTFLLSKDRSDIPTSLFPVRNTINVDTGTNNCVFSIYYFSKERYAARLEELLK